MGALFLAAALVASPAAAEPLPDAAPAPVATPPPVRANEPAQGAKTAALSRIIDRPHTVAEIEAGIIALPTAPISPAQRGGATPFGTIGRGDATVQVGLHVLYRWDRSWALGAGALFAPQPTSDQQYGGLGALPRTHSRSYLFLGGEGRWIPLHYGFFEGWVGVDGGAVIIADRFTNEATDPVPELLGPREVTIRTEGLALGTQVGGNYYLTPNWIAGANLRGGVWFLPEHRRCSPIGDCATLSGTVEAFELGLTLGYRLPL